MLKKEKDSNGSSLHLLFLTRLKTCTPCGKCGLCLHSQEVHLHTSAEMEGQERGPTYFYYQSLSLPSINSYSF